jgi:predicted dehydrogenase
VSPSRDPVVFALTCSRPCTAMTSSCTRCPGGIIGGGDQVSGDRIGQKVEHLEGHHREALSKSPRVKLVAGSDRDAGRRERFRGSTGATVYSDWRQMISREKLDLVSIATFSPFHAELTVACAEQGVRVIYCEKPIATRLVDAEKMLSACARTGTLLAINHNRRFSSNHRKLRDAIAAGELGELTTVFSRWSTGRLGNVGTHMIDVVRMFAGRRFLAVSGTLDPSGAPDCRGPEFRDPGGWGVVRMEGGLMFVIAAPDSAVGPAGVVIDGTLGRAVMQGSAIQVECWDGRKETWLREESGFTPMDQAVVEIVAWLDDGKPFGVSAEESLEVLEVIVGFHISDRQNAAWTQLPLSGKDRELEIRIG